MTMFLLLPTHFVLKIMVIVLMTQHNLHLIQLLIIFKILFFPVVIMKRKELEELKMKLMLMQENKRERTILVNMTKKQRILVLKDIFKMINWQI